MSSTCSDWRLRAPMTSCPSCGQAELRSRDCPSGIEIGCRACEWSEIRPAGTLPPPAEWLRRPFARVLGAMPDVGEDSDFLRLRAGENTGS
jgi:hypothetical protein